MANHLEGPPTLHDCAYRTLTTEMASNPPGKCCVEGFLHEGNPQGKLCELFGFKTYVSGQESKRIVVILSDIYGIKFINAQLIADSIARAGYYVLMPDILQGEDAIFDHPDKMAYLMDWLTRHSEQDTRAIVESFVGKVKEYLDPEFIGGIGYCFGAKYVIQQLTSNGAFDVGALAHPSFVTEEEVKAVAKPVLISAAETDSMFTPELRHKSEGILRENKAEYEISLYSGVEHGYAVRGDPNVPRVRYAQEKTLLDQLYFFDSRAK